MIPSEWLLAIPVAAAFGFMLAGLLRQASRADDCLECPYRRRIDTAVRLLCEQCPGYSALIAGASATFVIGTGGIQPRQVRLHRLGEVQDAVAGLGNACDLGEEHNICTEDAV